MFDGECLPVKILIIGESCRDVFHYGESVRLCPDAPVPVFKSLKISDNGGMAKNVQRNLQSLGCQTELITNSEWEQIRKTRYVDFRTNHMFLRVDENESTFGSLSVDRLEKLDRDSYDAVVVSDYNKGYLSEDVLYFISQWHPLVFLDTKKILGPWAEEFTFIKINNAEFKATEHTLNDNLRSRLIVTRGYRGSEFLGKIYTVQSVEVKDTSGAGDTFLSGLCYKYVETKDIVTAIKFGNSCSTKVVQKRGVSIL